MAVAAKDCHALTSYFIKVYNEKYNQAPRVNRHSARWGFDSVLQDMPAAEARALIDYYFTTEGQRGHDLDWFFYHYHELSDARDKSKTDSEHRKKLMEESKLRAQRWEQSGKQSIGNN